MRALRIHGLRDVRLEEVDTPDVTAGNVKVAVEWAGICGSDLTMYSEGGSDDVDLKHPVWGVPGPQTMGHEFAGRIAELGAGVSGLSVGAAVVVEPLLVDGTCAACARGQYNLCTGWGMVGINGGGGGWSDYVVVPAERVHALPANVPTDVGVLVEPLAVAWHAVRKSGVKPGDTAFVVGAGPIGLGAVRALQAQGVEKIIISEVSATRKEIAGQFGATVVDPTAVDVVAVVKERTRGAGADVAFEASGANGRTFQTMMDALRPGGTATQIASFHSSELPTINPFTDFMLTEKKLTGSFCYTSKDFREVIAAISDGSLSTEGLVTARVGFDHAVDHGLDALAGADREQHVKILISSSL